MELLRALEKGRIQPANDVGLAVESEKKTERADATPIVCAACGFGRSSKLRDPSWTPKKVNKKRKPHS